MGQTFRGIPCTYGDGRRTAFAPYAGCITSAPTPMKAYLKQQTRWNKSHYRELLWTLAFLPKLSRVIAVEVAAQAALPFLLTLAVLATLGRAAVEGPEVLLRYAVIVAGMAVLHCLFALHRTRDWLRTIPCPRTMLGRRPDRSGSAARAECRVPPRRALAGKGALDSRWS